VFWSIMTAVSGLARSFMQLFLCRIGVGIGEATLTPAANSIIADSFKKNRLATALSVYTMGIPIGVGFAYIIGAKMISLAGTLPDLDIASIAITKTWQKAFMLVGIPGLIVMFFVLFLREPSRKGADTSKRSMPVSEVWAFIMERKKAYISICVGMACVSALGFGSAAFLPTFFQRVHGVSPAEMGQIFGWIAVITGPIGLLAGGLIADRWMKKGIKDAYPKTLMIAPLGFFIPAVLFPFLDYSWLLWATVGASNLFLNLPAGAAYASLQVITPNRMRGQIVAVYVLVTNIGYTVGPLAIGVFSDTLFEGNYSIGYAMALLGLLTMPASLGLFYWGRGHYADALRREEERLNTLVDTA